MAVHTFYADPAVGGDGATFTDDNNPVTGLAANGHRSRLIAMFQNVVNMAIFVATKAAEALSSANSAVNAPGTSATSITTQTPAASSKAFTLAQTNKLFAIGQFVVVYNSATNWFAGQITAFTPGTGAITVLGIIVSATPVSASAWTVSLTAPLDTALSARTAALEAADAKLKARRRLLEKEML